MPSSSACPGPLHACPGHIGDPRFLAGGCCPRGTRPAFPSHKDTVLARAVQKARKASGGAADNVTAVGRMDGACVPRGLDQSPGRLLTGETLRRQGSLPLSRTPALGPSPFSSGRPGPHLSSVHVCGAWRWALSPAPWPCSPAIPAGERPGVPAPLSSPVPGRWTHCFADWAQATLNLEHSPAASWAPGYL